jgi:bifunctional non-homologous end joining protein LigD
MHGHKLKGEFSLVKLKGKQENAWLLIKKQDKYASKTDILKKDKSVISKKTLEMLDKKTPRGESAKTKKVAATPKPGMSNKVKKKPELIKPMMAKLIDKPFDDKDWLFEMKYDGYRTLAICDGSGNTHLYSRNLLSFNEKFAPIADELSSMQYPCLLDGEVVVEDEKGISDFQLLQNYQSTKKGKIKYYVFDLLSLNEEDTTHLPLLDRKQLLATLLKKHKFKNIFYSDDVKEKGIQLFKKAQKNTWEGIIGKRLDSGYQPDKRSGDWVKIKIVNEQEAIIIGITEPRGSREAFGSLLLAVYNSKKELDYIGNCGTGFDAKMLNTLYKKFKPLFIKTSPVKEIIKNDTKIQWLKPEIICQVKFSEWTQEEHMRHPVFLGLRVDKQAKEVKREIPKS